MGRRYEAAVRGRLRGSSGRSGLVGDRCPSTRLQLNFISNFSASSAPPPLLQSDPRIELILRLTPRNVFRGGWLLFESNQRFASQFRLFLSGFRIIEIVVDELGGDSFLERGCVLNGERIDWVLLIFVT